MIRVFHYNFGFDGELSEVDEEKVKEAISEYFSNRDDVELIRFIGNQSPPPTDIMRVKVETTHSVGYDIIEDLKDRELDHGVYIIQGGPD